MDFFLDMVAAVFAADLTTPAQKSLIRLALAVTGLGIVVPVAYNPSWRGGPGSFN